MGCLRSNHDTFLQFRSNQVQALRRGIESSVLALGIELEDLIAGKYQFANQIHELIEQAYPDPYVGIGYREVFAGSLVWLGSVRLLAIFMKVCRRDGLTGIWLGNLSILCMRRGPQTFDQSSNPS